jgi:hypothetical protein
MAKEPIPPSERHRAEQVPPRGPARGPDTDPDDLGQESEQSSVKPNTTTDKSRRQDRI